MLGQVEQRTLGGTCWLTTFGFGFRPKVTLYFRWDTVSAECVTSLSAYFRFRPKVKLPLSVDL